jgi:hypothetical protein
MSSEQKESKIVDALFDVGETWASYGLKTAENALAASARTLTSVSKLLGNLAEELKHEQKTDANVIDAPQS